MLPLYLLYFAGSKGESSTKKTLINAMGFVLGFTIFFVALGAFAGAVGGFLERHQLIVNIVTGAIVITFGLNYMGILKIPFLNGSSRLNKKMESLTFLSSVLFSMIFSIGWTPCVGAFLGSALMLAAQEGSILHGTLMLLVYSLGLGIPFILSAVLIDKLKGAFNFIKQHYRVVNIVCGSLLVVIGILMMTGLMNMFLGLMSF